jgi:hypothetical protein
MVRSADGSCPAIVGLHTQQLHTRLCVADGTCGTLCIGPWVPVCVGTLKKRWRAWYRWKEAKLGSTCSVQKSSFPLWDCITWPPTSAHVQVLVAPWVLHHSAREWGQDANTFQPERWLEAPLSTVKLGSNGAARWLPFLDGAQSCMGQQIALVRTL